MGPNFNSRKLKLNYLKYCLPWTKYSIGLRVPSLSPTTTINGESMSVEILSKTLVVPTLKRVNEAKTDVKPRKHDRNPLCNEYFTELHPIHTVDKFSKSYKNNCSACDLLET